MPQDHGHGWTTALLDHWLTRRDDPAGPQPIVKRSSRPCSLVCGSVACLCLIKLFVQRAEQIMHRTSCYFLTHTRIECHRLPHGDQIDECVSGQSGDRGVVASTACGWPDCSSCLFGRGPGGRYLNSGDEGTAVEPADVRLSSTLRGWL